MVRYHAPWVLPIVCPPIRNGWIDVEKGRIVNVGERGASAGRGIHVPGAVVLPGLVNAHTHLELSYLRGGVPPAEQFLSWIRHLVAERRKRQDPAAPEIMDAVYAAIDEAVASGTVLVGDISNTLVTAEPLTRRGLAGVVFYELIRFSSPDPDGVVSDAWRRLDGLALTPPVTSSVAAHAPYSVDPGIFRALAREGNRRGTPLSVHLSESSAELEFVKTGGGPWRRFLEDVGAWDASWTAPDVSPVEYLDRCGCLGPRTLAVHGVHMTPDDLERVAASGATIVTCPRSNARTGAGTPPLADFYAAGARVAVGTDSLASTPDLNVFAELAAMRPLAPHVAARELLASATRHGASVLGFDADLGTIEPGKRAQLIAVTVPPDVEDVEEYLVSGIEPGQIRWLTET